MNQPIRRFSTGPLPEFVERIGGVQRQGDRGVFGVAPQPPPNIQVEPQSGGYRHVYSVFDSRPIGAYDFEVPVILYIDSDFSSDSAFFTAQVGPFNGYAVFLRRVTVCYQKTVTFPLAYNDDYPVGHRIRVSRNGIFVPNIDAFTLASKVEYHLNTAVWFDPTDKIEADVQVLAPIAFPRGSVVVSFAGTLVPYTGEPAVQMAGSNERGVIERFINSLFAFFNRGVR